MQHQRDKNNKTIPNGSISLYKPMTVLNYKLEISQKLFSVDVNEKLLKLYE